MAWDNWLNEKRFTLFRSAIIQEQFIQCISDYTPKNGCILEAGFGFGTTTELLRDLGFDIEGFDLERLAVEQTGDRYPHLKNKLYLGDIRNRDTYTKVYDTIIHQGVLEHFTDSDILDILLLQAANCRKIIFDVPNCLRECIDDEGDGTRFETPEFWESMIHKAGLEFERFGRTYDYGNDLLPKQLLKYDSDLMKKVGRSSIFVVEGLIR